MHAHVEFGFGLPAYHGREMENAESVSRVIARSTSAGSAEIAGIAFNAWIGHRGFATSIKTNFFTSRRAPLASVSWPRFENAAGEATAEKSRAAGDHYAHPRPPVVKASRE